MSARDDWFGAIRQLWLERSLSLGAALPIEDIRQRAQQIHDERWRARAERDWNDAVRSVYRHHRPEPDPVHVSNSAYYHSLWRMRNNVPGSAQEDWLDAERIYTRKGF